jgi:hypothetical protein
MVPDPFTSPKWGLLAPWEIAYWTTVCITYFEPQEGRMIPLSFVRARSPLVPLMVLCSALLMGLHVPRALADTLSPQRVQELTDMGAQIADRERAMKEAEQQSQRPDLSPADRERLTKEVGDHRDFIKNTKDGVAAQGADQKRVLDRAIEARNKQYQLKDARAAAAKDPSDKKAQRTVKRLETELQNDYKDIGTLPILASAATPGSGAPSNLAAAVLNDECKKQVMLSSRSPDLPVAAGPDRLALTNARFAIRPSGNPLLHLVQRGDDQTKVDKSNLPTGIGSGQSTKIEGKFQGRGPGSLEVFDRDGKSHFLHVDKDGKYSGWVPDPNFKPVRAELQTGPDMQHIEKTYYSFQGGGFVEVPPQVQKAVQAIMLQILIKGHMQFTNTADVTKQARKTVKFDTFQGTVDYRHKDETPDNLAAGFLNWGQSAQITPVVFSGEVGKGDINLSAPTKADSNFFPDFKIGDWSATLMLGVDYYPGCRRIPESAFLTGGDVDLGVIPVNNNTIYNSVLAGGVDYWAFKGTMEQQGFTFDNWTPLHLGQQMGQPTVLVWEVKEETYQNFRNTAGSQVISGMFDVGINIAPAPSLDPAYWPQRPARAIPRWTIDRRSYREED